MTAARLHVGLIALLFALSGLAWWSTAARMHGMDMAPETLGWFLGVWVVMMAAMMLPSAAPAVTTYARMARAATPVAPLAFAAGYLLTWAVAGLAAYAVFELAGDPPAGIAVAALLVAAAYQLTPVKDACLTRCRHPFGFLATSWRNGLDGAVRMGAHHGAWCVGCCWALMAALLALGLMSLGWMAFVAALIALEKLLPWERAAPAATAAILLALAAATAAGLA